jgi:predicted nucleic acid-binding protein
MRALLDTCVLSELRGARPNSGVLQAIDEFASDDLYVSVVSAGEIAKGIALLHDSRNKRGLESWLRALEPGYADRLLPVDLETAHIWGELTAAAQKRGRAIPAADGLIAATAMRHGLHVMTRNTGDFEATGVLLLNPWT